MSQDKCVSCNSTKPVRVIVKGKSDKPKWPFCSAECAYKKVSETKGTAWKALTKDSERGTSNK